MGSDSIVDLAARYAQHQGLSLHTISTYMGGSGDTLQRLMDGRDMTTRRAGRMTQWLSDHWPADLAWPADIPRPAPDPSAQPLPRRRRSRAGSPAAPAPKPGRKGARA